MTRLLSGFDTVQDKDTAVLMRRSAAHVVLGAYVSAQSSRYCMFKVELCVGALLLQRNLTVGQRALATVIRDEQFCHLKSHKLDGLDASLRCGRALIWGHRTENTSSVHCGETHAAQPFDLGAAVASFSKGGTTAWFKRWLDGK